MIVLRTLFFIIACIFYPFRLVLFVIHAFLVFLGKPGARVILPLALVLALWIYGFGHIPLLETIAVAGDSFFQGLFSDSPDRAAFVTRWRDIFPAVALWFVLRIVFDIAMAMLRPLVHALPAPRRPLMPMVPLYIPKHVVKTIPARVAVAPLRMGKFRGNLSDIVPHLSPEIRDVLEPRSARLEMLPLAPITASATQADSEPVQEELPERGPERPSTPPREAKVPRRRMPPQQTPPAPSREE